MAQLDIDLPSAVQAFRRRKRLVRKAKAEAEEIKFLNIVAMVDVLTILLIFLLKSVSVSNTTAPTKKEMVLPMSTTQTAPIEAVKIVITHDSLLVEDQEVANINNGAVPDLELSPDNSLLIPDLQNSLMNWIRLAVVNHEGAEQHYNLEILADKDTPYHIVFQVAYTAGQSYIEVGNTTFGFDKYRLLVARPAAE